MSGVATGRAAIAGVLAAVIVILSFRPEPLGDQALTAVGVLLALIALLVVPDIISQWRNRNGKE